MYIEINTLNFRDRIVRWNVVCEISMRTTEHVRDFSCHTPSSETCRIPYF